MYEPGHPLSGWVLLDDWEIAIYVRPALPDLIADQVRRTVVTAFSRCAEEITDGSPGPAEFLVRVEGWGVTEQEES